MLPLAVSFPLACPSPRGATALIRHWPRELSRAALSIGLWNHRRCLAWSFGHERCMTCRDRPECHMRASCTSSSPLRLVGGLASAAQVWRQVRRRGLGRRRLGRGGGLVRAVAGMALGVRSPSAWRSRTRRHTACSPPARYQLPEHLRACAPPGRPPLATYCAVSPQPDAPSRAYLPFGALEVLRGLPDQCRGPACGLLLRVRARCTARRVLAVRMHLPRSRAPEKVGTMSSSSVHETCAS